MGRSRRLLAGVALALLASNLILSAYADEEQATQFKAALAQAEVR